MSLKIWFEQKQVGELFYADKRFSFEYLDSWLEDDEAFSLSFALPLRKKVFDDKSTRSFFENILTEGKMRAQLGKNNQIDESDEYSFLKEFGKDCAGALVINEEAINPSTWAKKEISLEAIKEKLARHESLYLDFENEDGVQFSLAGVQDKLPVIIENNKFYIGQYGHPSTHIIKPQVNVKDFKQTVLNEYICMQLAKDCGLNVPKVEILTFEDISLFVIERYDREGFRRLHQQDLCQSLELTSIEKYELRGGPGFSEIYENVKKHGQNTALDLFALLDWLCFNLLIGNHDSHAKNLSYLYKNGKWQLAPFYDLMSTAVYKGTTKNFAFSIGGQSEPAKLRRKNFNLLEEEIGVRSGTIIKRLKTMAQKIIKNYPKSDEFIVVKIKELIEKRINNFEQMVFGEKK